ncbi:MAG: ComF family protein [Betaproteobacteria bacterium]|nr:ComF family protein [Betaproteobacteria bacterium]
MSRVDSLPRPAAVWHRVRALADSALDAWLPRACALCEGPLRQAGAGLCGHCRLALPGRNRARCPRCALGLDAAGCAACAGHAFAFQASRVLADYAPPLDRLIGAVKFDRQLGLAHALGRELRRGLAPALRAALGAGADAAVVAVPLSAERLRERGFDQAAVLARALADGLGLPLLPALTRARATQAQSRLDLAARSRNLQDAFRPRALHPRLPARVVLVDDVITTGATADAAARALIAAGARRVIVAAVARTP